MILFTASLAAKVATALQVTGTTVSPNYRREEGPLLIGMTCMLSNSLRKSTFIDFLQNNQWMDPGLIGVWEDAAPLVVTALKH